MIERIAEIAKTPKNCAGHIIAPLPAPPCLPVSASPLQAFKATPRVRLTALRVSNGALAAGRLPGRIKVLDWGENPSVQGPVRVGEGALQHLAARQKELGFEEVAVDFEHNTVPGSPEYERTQEPRRVAGYGVPRVVAGEGLYLENLRWTPAGQAEALNFVDLSPAVALDETREVTFVHSVALTRNGAVEGLTFFSSDIPRRDPRARVSGSEPLHPPNPFMSEPTQPNSTPVVDKILTLAALAGALGLTADASEADVLARLKPLSALPDFARLNERLEKLERANALRAGYPASQLEAFDTRLAALQAETAGLKLELQRRDAAALEAEKAALIQRFAAEGKVPLAPDRRPYSDEQLTALDLPTLKLLHANTPSTVPLSARGRKASSIGAASGSGTNSPPRLELKGLDRAIAAHAASA